MSIPSGKPFDPFDVSAYVPKHEREQSSDGGGHDRDTDSEEHLRYAPLKARERTTSSLHAVPKLDRVVTGRAEGGSASEFVPMSASDEPGTGLQSVGGSGEEYLRRLASSSQREGVAGRLPRAVQLPPVQGLASLAVTSSAERVPRSGESFINGFRVPPSLEPEFLRRPAPPIRERKDHLRGPLRILMASVVAAPIAYYFSADAFLSKSDSGRGQKVSSTEVSDGRACTYHDGTG